MSIIRVSSKNRGKINRVYGTSNYIAGPAPKKKYNEKDYYTRLINIAKEYVYAKNNKKYIKRIRVNGNRLSEKTLFKILNAYKDTLPVIKNFANKSRVDYISNGLERNLKKHKVSPSTIQNILKYDTHYKEKVVKKKSPHEKKIKRQVDSKTNTKKLVSPIQRRKTKVTQSSGKHQTRVSHVKKSYQNKDSHLKNKQNMVNNPKPTQSKVKNKMSDYELYIFKIIQFSYKNPNDGMIDAFIGTLNSKRKILSETLIRNIISAYKDILSISKNKNKRIRLINTDLEHILLEKGVHIDTIEIIIQLDSNYKS